MWWVFLLTGIAATLVAIRPRMWLPWGGTNINSGRLARFGPAVVLYALSACLFVGNESKLMLPAALVAALGIIGMFAGFVWDLCAFKGEIRVSRRDR